MLWIDCDTDDSALSTTAAAFGINETDLKEIIRSLGASQADDETWLRSDNHNKMLCKLESIVGRKAVFDGVCYFHFTRVKPQEVFECGLVPSTDRLDAIWSMLEELLPVSFDRQEWCNVKRDMEHDSSHWANLYRLKTCKRTMSGPFGQLVRRVAFIPEWNGIHYLATPETIEDICFFFQSRHEFELQRAFIEATRPCIVKFVVSGTDRDALNEALQFIYRNERGFGPAPDMLCHDARGSPIDPSRILRVEFVEDIYGQMRLQQHAKKFDSNFADGSDWLTFL